MTIFEMQFHPYITHVTLVKITHVTTPIYVKNDNKCSKSTTNVTQLDLISTSNKCKKMYHRRQQMFLRLLMGVQISPMLENIVYFKSS